MDKLVRILFALCTLSYGKYGLMFVLEVDNLNASNLLAVQRDSILAMVYVCTVTIEMFLENSAHFFGRSITM